MVAELCNSQMCIHGLYILICMYYVSIQGHVCACVCTLQFFKMFLEKKQEKMVSLFGCKKKLAIHVVFS